MVFRKIIGFGVILAVCVAYFLIQHSSIHNLEHQTHKYCYLSDNACLQNDVSMKLNTPSVSPLHPVTMIVEWKNTGAQNLTLQFTGLEMEMGHPKFILHKTTDGHYRGSITMPACKHGAMTWLGELSDGTDKVYPALKVTK